MGPGGGCKGPPSSLDVVTRSGRAGDVEREGRVEEGDPDLSDRGLNRKKSESETHGKFLLYVKVDCFISWFFYEPLISFSISFFLVGKGIVSFSLSELLYDHMEKE